MKGVFKGMIRGSTSGQSGIKNLPFSAKVGSSVPGWGAKIFHVLRQKKKKGKQNIQQKQYFNKFHKDFKNGPHWEKKKAGLGTLRYLEVLDSVKCYKNTIG